MTCCCHLIFVQLLIRWDIVTLKHSFAVDAWSFFHTIPLSSSENINNTSNSKNGRDGKLLKRCFNSIKEKKVISFHKKGTKREDIENYRTAARLHPLWYFNHDRAQGGKKYKHLSEVEGLSSHIPAPSTSDSTLKDCSMDRSSVWGAHISTAISVPPDLPVWKS